MPEQYPYPKTDWTRGLGMTQQEQFMIQHHRNNLAKGGVKNPDGSTSTYKSIGVTVGDRYYMLPTIWDNKEVSAQEAVSRAQKVGFDRFPSYDTPEQGEARYQQLHGYMERDLQK
jgi:hypothetical protein